MQRLDQMDDDPPSRAYRIVRLNEAWGAGNMCGTEILTLFPEKNIFGKESYY